MYEGKYDTRDKNLLTLLANSSNHCQPGPVSQYRMQVSNTFTVFQMQILGELKA